MMATYEAAVYVMTTYYSPNEAEFYEGREDWYKWYYHPYLYIMVSFWFDYINAGQVIFFLTQLSWVNIKKKPKVKRTHFLRGSV